MTKTFYHRNISNKEKWKKGTPTHLVAVKEETGEWEAFGYAAQGEVTITTQVILNKGVKLTREEAKTFFPDLDISKYKKDQN